MFSTTCIVKYLLIRLRFIATAERKIVDYYYFKVTSTIKCNLNLRYFLIERRVYDMIAHLITVMRNRTKERKKN